MSRPDVISVSCHCGNVQIEASSKPRSPTTCNCSICRRLAALWAHYTRLEARLISPPDSVVAYVWGDETIEFYRCVVCGCSTHYESVEKNDGSRFSVNARCMPAEYLEGITVRPFDGPDSWTFVE